MRHPSRVCVVHCGGKVAMLLFLGASFSVSFWWGQGEGGKGCVLRAAREHGASRQRTLRQALRCAET